MGVVHEITIWRSPQHKPVIALVAHDGKKNEMLLLAGAHLRMLGDLTLMATQSTGRMLREELGLEVDCFASGPEGGDKVHRTFTHTPPALRMPLVGCGHGSRTRDHDLAVAPAQAGDRSRRARRQEERDVAARRRAPADAGRPDADGDAIDGSNVARRVGVGGRLLRKRTRRWRQGSPNVHAHASSTSHAARRLRAWES